MRSVQIHPDWQLLWWQERALEGIEALSGASRWLPPLRSVIRLRRYARRRLRSLRKRTRSVESANRSEYLAALRGTYEVWRLYDFAFMDLMGAVVKDVALLGIGGHNGVDPALARLAKEALPNLPTWLHEHLTVDPEHQITERAAVLLGGWARLRLSTKDQAGTRLRQVLEREALEAGHADIDLALRARLPNAALTAFLEWEPGMGETGRGSFLSRLTRDIEGRTERDSQGRPLLAGNTIDADIAVEEDFSARERIRELQRRAGLAPREAAWLDLYLQDMTETEIAAALGVKVGTVRQFMARAKAKLRRAAGV